MNKINKYIRIYIHTYTDIRIYFGCIQSFLFQESFATVSMANLNVTPNGCHIVLGFWVSGIEKTMLDWFEKVNLPGCIFLFAIYILRSFRRLNDIYWNICYLWNAHVVVMGIRGLGIPNIGGKCSCAHLPSIFDFYKYLSWTSLAEYIVSRFSLIYKLSPFDLWTGFVGRFTHGKVVV